MELEISIEVLVMDKWVALGDICVLVCLYTVWIEKVSLQLNFSACVTRVYFLTGMRIYRELSGTRLLSV